MSPTSTAPRPVEPRGSGRSMYLLHHLLEPNAGYRRLAGWLETRPRLRRLFTAADLLRLQRPIDHRLWGHSSWLSYWQGRDEDMWAEADGRAAIS